MQQAIANERQSGRAPAEGAVLLLCHRVPYPPDKGDKIRSYRWLTGLAERYRVYLGAFIDDPADWAHAERLQPYCAELCLLPLVPLRAKLRGLPALLRAESLTSGYYRDRRMSAWVAICTGCGGSRGAAHHRFRRRGRRQVASVRGPCRPAHVVAVCA